MRDGDAADGVAQPLGDIGGKAGAVRVGWEGFDFPVFARSKIVAMVTPPADPRR